MNIREKEAARGGRSAVNYDARTIIRLLAPKILFAICGYFASLGELAFGARPFGLALLAAAGREAPFAYAGAVIAAFVNFEISEALVYFGVYTLLIFMRIAFFAFKRRRRDEGEGASPLSYLFCEPVPIRIISSATVGVALGSAVLFAGGLLYYDLFALLLISLCAPTLTAILCGFFKAGAREKKELGADAEADSRNERKAEGSNSSKSSKKYSLLSELRALGYGAGFLTLCAICVYGGAKTNIYGVSLSVFSALLISFFATYKWGLGYGAICGLVLGVAYSPMLAPLFVIASLCAGIFVKISPSLATFCAFFSCCAWAFYVEGLSALSGIFGGILSACLLYPILHKIVFKDFLSASKTSKSSAEKEKSKSDAHANIRCTPLDESALDGVRLSQMNFRMSAISDALSRLSALQNEIKREEGGDARLNVFYGEKYNELYSDSLGELDCAALSAVLSKAMENEESEYKADNELSERLCLTLSELGLFITGVIVYGVRKKTIYIKGKRLETLESGARDIIDSISPLLPFSLDRESYFVRRDGELAGALTLFESEKITASVVRRRVTARNEAVCGDSVAVFKNRDGRFFALVSDGMGSGENAHLVARLCSGFVSNMLSVGRVSDELLSLLNGFLRGGCRNGVGECSATLDLLEIDLMNGASRLFKCGAAPSYVYRNGRLFKLRSETMPIGILREVDVKSFDMGLRRGDTVIMISDGVTGEGGECPWLFDLLSQNLPSRGPERIAELIVKYATAKGDGDDISVVVVAVK